jgi:hypothetical protein
VYSYKYQDHVLEQQKGNVVDFCYEAKHLTRVTSRRPSRELTPGNAAPGAKGRDKWYQSFRSSASRGAVRVFLIGVFAAVTRVFDTGSRLHRRLSASASRHRRSSISGRQSTWWCWRRIPEKSSTLTQPMFSAMATFKHTSDEQWEKMMEVLDRLEDRLEAVMVGQHRLQKQADRVAAAARKAQEREFLIVARTETTAHDMIDEISTKKVVWDAEVLFDFDSHGLLQRLAQGEGDQTHNNCEHGVVSDVPCMLVGMPHQANTHLMFSEVGLKVAWDEEMQSETHMHEGLLKQLAQGGEDLEESTSKAADVEDVICNENMLHDFNSHNDLRQQLANDQVFHARSDNEIRDEETGHDELLDQLASNGNDVSASEQHYLVVSDDSSQECTRAQAEIIEEEKLPKADENHVLDDRQLQPPVLEASPACSTFERQNVMQHEASVSSQGSLTSFEEELTSYGDNVQAVGEHQLVVSKESLEECKRDEVKRNIQKAVKSDGGYVLDCRNFSLLHHKSLLQKTTWLKCKGLHKKNHCL